MDVLCVRCPALEAVRDKIDIGNPDNRAITAEQTDFVPRCRRHAMRFVVEDHQEIREGELSITHQEENVTSVRQALV